MVPRLTWERVAHHSHLYVLPLAGAGAIALGSLSLLGVLTEFERWFPLALMLVGSTAVVGSVASHICSRPTSESERPSHEEPSRPVPVAPAPASADIALRNAAGARSWENVPFSGIGRAAVSRFARVGDELWRMWGTPKAPPLGAHLVGPVPETAYSAPKAGAFVAFPEKDRDAQRMPSVRARPTTPVPFAEPVGAPVSRRVGRPVPSAIPIAPTYERPKVSWGLSHVADLQPESSSHAPLPPMGSPFRSLAKSGATRRAVGDRSSGPQGSPGRTLASPSSHAPFDDVGSFFAGPAGLLPTLDSLDHLASFDSSINPILTHLRPSDPSAVATRSPRDADPSAQRPLTKFCSDCSRHLSDFRTWVDCRVCRKPMCRHCLSQSFMTDAEGTCSHCRDQQRWRTG